MSKWSGVEKSGFTKTPDPSGSESATLITLHLLRRSIYSLVLGENNAADQSRLMQEQMSMQVLILQYIPVPVIKTSQ